MWLMVFTSAQVTGQMQGGGCMVVGCVREIKNNEFRVGMTPDNVKAYVQAGHEVLIERGAGTGSLFRDEEYAAAGARLTDTAREVWDECEMMIKVKERICTLPRIRN